MAKRECKCGILVCDIKLEDGTSMTVDVVKQDAVQADTNKMYRKIKVYAEHRCK